MEIDEDHILTAGSDPVDRCVDGAGRPGDREALRQLSANAAQKEFVIVDEEDRHRAHPGLVIVRCTSVPLPGLLLTSPVHEELGCTWHSEGLESAPRAFLDVVASFSAGSEDPGNRKRYCREDSEKVDERKRRDQVAEAREGRARCKPQ